MNEHKELILSTLNKLSMIEILIEEVKGALDLLDTELDDLTHERDSWMEEADRLAYELRVKHHLD